MNKTLLAFSLSLLTLSAAQASEWGYGNDKHGPEHWGEIAKTVLPQKTKAQSTSTTLPMQNWKH